MVESRFTFLDQNDPVALLLQRAEKQFEGGELDLSVVLLRKFLENMARVVGLSVGLSQEKDPHTGQSEDAAQFWYRVRKVVRPPSNVIKCVSEIRSEGNEAVHEEWHGTREEAARLLAAAVEVAKWYKDEDFGTHPTAPQASAVRPSTSSSSSTGTRPFSGPLASTENTRHFSSSSSPLFTRRQKGWAFVIGACLLFVTVVGVLTPGPQVAPPFPHQDPSPPYVPPQPSPQPPPSRGSLRDEPIREPTPRIQRRMEEHSGPPILVARAVGVTYALGPDVMYGLDVPRGLTTFAVLNGTVVLSRPNGVIDLNCTRQQFTTNVPSPTYPASALISACDRQPALIQIISINGVSLQNNRVPQPRYYSTPGVGAPGQPPNPRYTSTPGLGAPPGELPDVPGVGSE